MPKLSVSVSDVRQGGRRRSGAGFHGGYAIEAASVRARETSGLCEVEYAVTLTGPALRIHVAFDGCGDSDFLAQRTIFETADFGRGIAPGGQSNAATVGGRIRGHRRERGLGTPRSATTTQPTTDER